MRVSNRFFAMFSAGILACSVLFGCSGPEALTGPEPTPVPANAAELAGYVSEALSEVTSMEYDTETYLKAVMNLGDLLGTGEESEETGAEMTAKVNMTAQASIDPEVVHSNGTVDVSVFGEVNTQETESYAVHEGEQYVIYTNYGDDTWTRSEAKDFGENDLVNRSMFDAVKDGRIRADLVAEKVKMGEKDAYQLDIELSGDEIMEYIGNTIDNLNSIFGDDYDDALRDASLSITLYIEPDTNLPIHMEFNATELGDKIMSYVQSYIEVTVSEFTVSADYKSYNEIPAVTIPEDIIANAVPAETEDDYVSTDEEMTDSGLADDEYSVPEADGDGKYRISSESTGNVAAVSVPEGQTVSYGESGALFTTGVGTDMPYTQYIFCFIDNMTSEELLELARQTEWLGEVEETAVSDSQVGETTVIDVNGHEVTYVLKSAVLYAGTEQQSYSAEINGWTEIDGTMFVISYDYYDEGDSTSDDAVDYDSLIRAAFECVTFEKED